MATVKEQLVIDLIRDEGLKTKPYTDTEGFLTIGVGRNLDDVGLSQDEIRYLLSNDIERVIYELDNVAPWWSGMTEARQIALANMAFNLGITRLSKFINMLSALEAGEYERAAKEALDSKWATQVGARAYRIAEQIKEG